MKLRSTALLLLALVTIGATPERKPVVLTIFHTNDLHSRLRASKNDPFGLGGLARIKTLLGTLRAKAQDSITLDAGDWSEGAWYFNVDAGSNMLRFMDELGYDAICAGNHELLNGPGQVIKTVRDASPRFPVLAANLDPKDYPQAQELKQWVPDTAILDYRGLKIGVIGLTIAPGEYDTFMSPVKIKDPVETAKRIAETFRNQVDVLLVVSHNEMGTNRRIAREVPGVDAVISGHSHVKTPKPYIEKNEGRDVPVVETGYWGKFVGELKLEIQTQRTVDPKGAIKVKSYELHPITPDIPEDPTMAAEFVEQDRLLSERYGMDVQSVVAEAETELEQDDHRETLLGNLVVKSYRSATGADAALEATTFNGIGIAQGPVTVMDLHDAMPHTWNPITGKEWTVHIWNARGKDVSTVISTFYFVTGILPASSPVGWLAADNVHLQWTPLLGKSGFNVRGVTIDGRPIEKEKRYRIAISDGMLRGIQVASEKIPFLKVDISDVQDTGIEAWRAVLDYGSKPGNLALSNLKIGGSSQTTGGDLAIFPYDVWATEGKLHVRVENIGIRKSDEVKVECATGIPDGLIPYNTDDQRWKKLGNARADCLAPGASVELELPWDQSSLKGFWPVRCKVKGGRYRQNDRTTKVFHF